MPKFTVRTERVRYIVEYADTECNAAYPEDALRVVETCGPNQAWIPERVECPETEYVSKVILQDGKPLPTHSPNEYNPMLDYGRSYGD